MAEDKQPVDSGVLLRALLCIVLGGILFLFIHNNHLFAHGNHILFDIEVLVMLILLSVPFLLSMIHFFRSLLRK